MLLEADVQAGIVVDRNGVAQGLMTADTIADEMRASPRTAAAAAPQAATAVPAQAAATVEGAG